MAYATIEQLRTVWPALPTDQEATATALLEDAAVHIDAAFPRADPVSDAAARRVVSCGMVKRALTSPSEGAGVSSVQMGAGPYQRTTQYANPTGDLYLSKADRRLLGAGRQVIYTIPIGGFGPVEEES